MKAYIFLLGILLLLTGTIIAYWPELVTPQPRYATSVEVEKLRVKIDRMETKYIRVKDLMTRR